MKISQILKNSQIFYHGSAVALPKQTPLESHVVTKSAPRANSIITKLLEQYKPTDQPSRLQCWFMCDSIIHVKLSTASTKFIYVVQPSTPVFCHHYGWVSAAEAEIKKMAWKLHQDHDIDINTATLHAIDDLVKKDYFVQYIANYWSGTPFSHPDVGSIILHTGGGAVRLVEYTTNTIVVVKRVL